MRIQVHADDLGLSESINRAIFSAYDHGRLDSTSLIINAPALHTALVGLRQRPGLSCGLHFNLIEGRPITAPDALPLLVNKQGQFRHSFPGLLWRSLFAPVRYRRNLMKQIEIELKAQLDCFFEKTGRPALTVDGHQHTHAIPVVHAILRRLNRNGMIRTCRGLREGGSTDLLSALRPATLVNRMKSLLLARLERGNYKRGSESQLPVRNQWLVGVLHSGDMNLRALKYNLSRLTARAALHDTVELLFHPAYPSHLSIPTKSSESSAVDADRSNKQAIGRRFYFDFTDRAAREREYLLLISDEWQELKAQFLSHSELFECNPAD
ncbi:MAG: ChbG/HpnK family deacetylase [Leptospiraceae bacterium]|nr:ChbG/HpnK family deacetylase [Leptospiraceae bacterium]